MISHDLDVASADARSLPVLASFESGLVFVKSIQVSGTLHCKGTLMQGTFVQVEIGSIIY